MIRQGDVLLNRIDSIDKETKLVGKDKYTLAFGEKTGHHHDIIGDVKIYKTNNNQVLLSVGQAGAVLTHQEHSYLTVPSGIWEVRLQREFTTLDEIRIVRD